MQGQTSGVRVNEHLECGNGETVFRNTCKLGLCSTPLTSVGRWV